MWPLTRADAVSYTHLDVYKRQFLGLPLPWLRLSILGALTYELPAATSAAAALDVSISEGVADPRVYSTIAWVMTLGIMSGLLIVTLFLKKIQGGIQSLSLIHIYTRLKPSRAPPGFLLVFR